MDIWKNNTIWFDQIPANEFANLNLQEAGWDSLSNKDLEYLVLWRHRSKAGGFTDTPIPESLLYLELIWSNLKNFVGIGKLGNLKRLELQYCLKLESDSGLSEIAGTLEHLHIHKAKKFVPGEELLSLKNLRVLRLNSCGPLENLSFLSQFPNLIDFRFVDTDVLDGDLSPLVDHPTIRSAGYSNKRHYNIKPERMNELLEQKNGGKAYEQEIVDDKPVTYLKAGKRITYRLLD